MPRWQTKKPADMTPAEWATVLTHPEGIAAGCSELAPSPLPNSVHAFLKVPANRLYVFGDETMTYRQWRTEGTEICPNHAHRVTLGAPLGPLSRQSYRGNLKLKRIIGLAPYKPACVIAADHDFDVAEVRRYKNNFQYDRDEWRAQQANWEHRMLSQGLDEWLAKGYSARAFNIIKKRHIRPPQ